MRVRLTWNNVVKSSLLWFVMVTSFYVFFKKGYFGNFTTKSESYTIFDNNLLESANKEINYEKTSTKTINFSVTKKYETRNITKSESTQTVWQDGLPTIYMVTPTYRRAEQIPELTRTAQTLLHVKNLVWIVAEDAPKPSQEVLDYLKFSGLNYVYLRAEMPSKYAKHTKKPRGVSNRNAGIEWVRKNATEGVVYFGDDDNTYDLRIFEEIRYTKRVSMFPVGLVTKLGVSSPIVKNGKVIGFYDGWIAKRKFPVDMAGFAINVKLFLEHPNALMPYEVGYEEDGLLKNLGIKPSDVEPKAQNCTKIWVWHTQSKKNEVVKTPKLKSSLEQTNLADLRNLLWKGV